MRKYIDENVNPRIVRFVPGHTFGTPISMGWKGLTNGRLMAELDGRFDALLTHDQNIPSQQNLDRKPLMLVVLDMPGRTLADYEATAPAVERALVEETPGSVVRVKLE